MLIKKMKILFQLRKNRGKNSHPIEFRITVSGCRRSAPISTGLMIEPKYWNQEEQQAKGFKLASEINNELYLIRSRLMQIHHNLQLRGDYFTSKTIKDIYKGIEKPEITFLKAFDSLIEHQSKKRKYPYSEKTLTSYQNRRNNIKAYLESIDKLNLMPDEWKTKHMENFTIFLKGTIKEHNKAKTGKSDFSLNYVARHIEVIKNVLEYCISQEIIDKSPAIYYQVEKENRTDKTHLSEDELKKLESFKFNSQFYTKIQDLYIFLCYTGFNHADLVNFACNPDEYLEKEDGKEWIVLNRQKLRTNPNSIPQVQPFFAEAKAIFLKYKKQLPVISLQVFNRTLKEIIEIIGIKKKITTKTARKTFVNLLYNKGIDIRVVAAMVGHASIRTTEQNYASTNKNFILEELKKLG